MPRRRQEPPLRIRWALELLDVAAGDQVLEFGCGPGVAAAMVAERLSEGSITAIDRSATAISRARLRNAGLLESGRMELETVDLAGFRSEKRFDKAFGVNVNVFWTGPADSECRVLRTVLADHGVVHLIYDGPGGGPRPGMTDQVVANLHRHRFLATARHGPTPSLVCITGRLR